jgi:hypothetical protein
MHIVVDIHVKRAVTLATDWDSNATLVSVTHVNALNLDAKLFSFTYIFKIKTEVYNYQ